MLENDIHHLQIPGISVLLKARMSSYFEPYTKPHNCNIWGTLWDLGTKIHINASKFPHINDSIKCSYVILVCYVLYHRERERKPTIGGNIIILVEAFCIPQLPLLQNLQSMQDKGFHMFLRLSLIHSILNKYWTD